MEVEKMMPKGKKINASFKVKIFLCKYNTVLTAVSAVECMLSKGIDIAMNEYNTRKETVSEEDYG